MRGGRFERNTRLHWQPHLLATVGRITQSCLALSASVNAECILHVPASSAGSIYEVKIYEAKGIDHE